MKRNYDNPRTLEIKVRLNQDEKDRLKAKAAEQNTELAAMLRDDALGRSPKKSGIELNLTETQEQAIRQRAEQLGISFEEVIRRIVLSVCANAKNNNTFAA